MDTVEQVKGYFYKGYWNLTVVELWNLILIDATSQHLDIEASSVAMILAGQPWVPTRTKPGGAIEGTSVASIMSRRMLPNVRLPLGLSAFTPIGRSLKDIRMARTNKVGAIIGRYIPWLGWGQAMWVAHSILRDTAQTFNRIVAPQDRIQWTYF